VYRNTKVIAVALLLSVALMGFGQNDQPTNASDAELTGKLAPTENNQVVVRGQTMRKMDQRF
jgi:hypothetical protein